MTNLEKALIELLRCDNPGDPHMLSVIVSIRNEMIRQNKAQKELYKALLTCMRVDRIGRRTYESELEATGYHHALRHFEKHVVPEAREIPGLETVIDLPEEIGFCKRECQTKPGLAKYLRHDVDFEFNVSTWRCLKFGWCVDNDGKPCKALGDIYWDHIEKEKAAYIKEFPYRALMRELFRMLPGRVSLSKSGKAIRLDPGESIVINGGCSCTPKVQGDGQP